MKLNKEHHKPGIYCIRNIINNKVYIGKARNIYTRINQHRCAFRKGTKGEHNDYFFNSWVKYGEENFEYFVLEYLEINEELFKERELYWMKIYDSCNRKKGYNLRQDSCTNMIVHEETSKKISKRLKKEWKEGNRKDHGKKLSQNWETNIGRKENQSLLFSKTLTKYKYNIYKNDILLYTYLYIDLKKNGFNSVLSNFHRQKSNIVKFKEFVIERINN